MLPSLLVSMSLKSADPGVGATELHAMRLSELDSIHVRSLLA